MTGMHIRLLAMIPLYILGGLFLIAMQTGRVRQPGGLRRFKIVGVCTLSYLIVLGYVIIVTEGI